MTALVTARRVALHPDDCRWPLPEPARGAVVDRMCTALTGIAGPRAVDSGGDLLRPALTLGTAALSGVVPDRAVSAAAAVELLHRATLVRDDVLVPAALLAGRAAGDDVTAELSRALAATGAGRQAERRLRFDPTASPEQALAVARERTAALVRAACVVGAEAAGLPASGRAALADYGSAFGLVVQIVDDVLDLVSTPDLAGRPVATDFAAGRMTLPITHALALRPELAGLLGPDAGPEQVEAAHVLVLRSGGVAAAVRTAVDHAHAAERALRALDGAAEVDPRALGRLARGPLRYLDALPRRVVPALRLLLHCGLDGTAS